MKQFFFVLLCLCTLLTGFGKATNAKEGTLAQELKSLSFLDVLSNGADGKSFISQENGVGEWTSTPYGKIRLLSSDSGTLNLKQALLGVQIIIDEGVYLKSPLLTLTQAQNVKEHHFFIPVSLPFEPAQGLTYKQSVTFPLSLTLQESNKPVQVTAQIKADFCTSDKCERVTESVSLTVPAGYNFFTPFSSFLDYSLGLVPYPASDGQIQIGALSDNIFWIKVDLPQAISHPSFLFLNAENLQPVPYTLLQKSTAQNQGLFIFQTSSDVKGQKLMAFIHDRGMTFSKNMTLTKAALPKLSVSNKVNRLPFYVWILFLLLLPALNLILTQNPRNEIEAKKENLKNILGVMSGVLCGIPIYLLYPYVELSQSTLWLSFGTLLFLFLGRFSYPVTRFGYGVLTAIIPFFAFWQNFGIGIPNTLPDLTRFFCLLASLCALPFLILLFKPYWSVLLGRFFAQRASYKWRFFFFFDAILFIYLLLFVLF